MKENLKGLMVFVYYYLFSVFNTLPVYLVGIDYGNLGLGIKVTYQIIVNILFIISLFFIYKDLLISFKDYCKNFKTYFKDYFKYWPMAYGLMIISNIFILLISPGNTANNQEMITDILVQAPFYMIVSAVIFAPIIEEIVFRSSFRKMFTNDVFFIFMSGIIFGSMHVVGSLDSFVDLIFILPYSVPGFVFAYTLVKSKNVFVPMQLHFIHNAFSMILTLVAISLL